SGGRARRAADGQVAARIRSHRLDARRDAAVAVVEARARTAEELGPHAAEEARVDAEAAAPLRAAQRAEARMVHVRTEHERAPARAHAAPAELEVAVRVTPQREVRTARGELANPRDHLAFAKRCGRAGHGARRDRQHARGSHVRARAARALQRALPSAASISRPSARVTSKPAPFADSARART